MAIIFSAEAGQCFQVKGDVGQVIADLADRFDLDPNDDEVIGDCLGEMGWNLFDDDDIVQSSLDELLKE